MWEVAAATRPAPGRANEDAYLAGPGFAAVLDGCTAPPGRDSGCVHDVPWFVAQLAANLAAGMHCDGDADLSLILSQAIIRTRDGHRGSCDLSHPDSPSSTVTLLRRRAEYVDYLVLGDSPLVWREASGVAEPVIDDRVEHLPDYTFDTVARMRNHPDGFWVAAADPNAASQALQGSRPVAEVSRALLLTDGASRLVERYRRQWLDVLNLAERDGPESVARQAHEHDAVATARRGKQFDDATVVLCRW